MTIILAKLLTCVCVCVHSLYWSASLDMDQFINLDLRKLILKVNAKWPLTLHEKCQQNKNKKKQSQTHILPFINATTKNTLPRTLMDGCTKAPRSLSTSCEPKQTGAATKSLQTKKLASDWSVSHEEIKKTKTKQKRKKKKTECKKNHVLWILHVFAPIATEYSFAVCICEEGFSRATFQLCHDAW